MTEQEAKTKTCCGPNIVLLGLLVTTGKKISDPVGPMLCVGSACMAWRWTERRTPAGTNPAGGSFAAYGEDRGYCGLAGKP